LVVEDAPCGVQAATAAGMRVIVVPSLVNLTIHALNDFRARCERVDANFYSTSRAFSHLQPDFSVYPSPDPDAETGVIDILPSLLAFQPERYGLPPFSDFIAETVPLDPVWRIQGTVVRGFGRGSKELGIPTANLDAAAVRGALAEAVTGIYGGWARVGGDGEERIYPMVMSVGWNPVFNNKEKTCEPWILHDFKGESFYGKQIRLMVVTFIRPEANLESVDALVARIHKDAEVTLEALKHPLLDQYKYDDFLR
jgi:riboflavin kinase